MVGISLFTPSLLLSWVHDAPLFISQLARALAASIIGTNRNEACPFVLPSVPTSGGDDEADRPPDQTQRGRFQGGDDSEKSQ